MFEDNVLKPEDYNEPDCVLCMDKTDVKPIDTRRFIEKLDSYFGRNDYDGAERHLIYWLGEAESGNDLRGQFTVYNEMMGLYRKTGRYNEAVAAVDKALYLISSLGIEDTAAAGTAYVNAATVYKTFKKSDTALPLFEKAKVIYEKTLKENDRRTGGLYNNMALALTDLNRYGEAIEYYEKAINIMTQSENGELEAAISYLNMANAKEAQVGSEAAEEFISDCVEKAKALIDTKTLKRDGYYAFVCDKCAPTFEYYGYFLYANELKETAKKIYERS